MRSTSSRLPRKPLLDVAGRTALQRVAERAAAAASVGVVVIATTSEASDDALAEHARECGLTVHRGPLHDVLRRLAEAAAAYDLDVVVEVDGDDLLASTEYMDAGVDELLTTGADFVSYRGLPLGATPNIALRSALENAVRWKRYTDTETGIFRFLLESGRFDTRLVEIHEERHRHDSVRMTLDYAEDLAFFRAVYERLDRVPGWTLADLVQMLRDDPGLVALNAGLDEIYRAHFQAGLSDMEPANDGDS